MLNFKLGDQLLSFGAPLNCSRPILSKTRQMSQAFYLPQLSFIPVEGGDFIGDVEQGGSCNVRQLSFTPHNLTHIETANHIVTTGKTLADLPTEVFSGLGYLIDLSPDEFKDRYIHPHHLKALETLEFKEALSVLLIKTSSSLHEFNHDFSGTDPISLHPSATAYLSIQFPAIRLLVLDLPSADKEDDGGLLASHKNFFGLSESEHGMDKAIVELAYFPDADARYYYASCTPPMLDLDAIITGLVLYPITD